MNFLNIQENKAKNLFMLFDLFILFDELMLAFQIDFHHHNFFIDFQIFTFKNCMTN